MMQPGTKLRPGCEGSRFRSPVATSPVFCGRVYTQSPPSAVEAVSVCCGLSGLGLSQALLLRENTKWRMTPVLREGLEAPGALESEAAAASAEALAAASEAGAVAGVGAGAEAAELAEAKPRTRSGSPSPSWAAWSKT